MATIMNLTRCRVYTEQSKQRFLSSGRHISFHCPFTIQKQLMTPEQSSSQHQQIPNSVAQASLNIRCKRSSISVSAQFKIFNGLVTIIQETRKRRRIVFESDDEQQFFSYRYDRDCAAFDAAFDQI